MATIAEARAQLAKTRKQIEQQRQNIRTITLPERTRAELIKQTPKSAQEYKVQKPIRQKKLEAVKEQALGKVKKFEEGIDKYEKEVLVPAEVKQAKLEAEYRERKRQAELRRDRAKRKRESFYKGIAKFEKETGMKITLGKEKLDPTKQGSNLNPYVTKVTGVTLNPSVGKALGMEGKIKMKDLDPAIAGYVGTELTKNITGKVPTSGPQQVKVETMTVTELPPVTITKDNYQAMTREGQTPQFNLPTEPSKFSQPTTSTRTDMQIQDFNVVDIKEAIKSTASTAFEKSKPTLTKIYDILPFEEVAKVPIATPKQAFIGVAGAGLLTARAYATGVPKGEKKEYVRSHLEAAFPGITSNRFGIEQSTLGGLGKDVQWFFKEGRGVVKSSQEQFFEEGISKIPGLSGTKTWGKQTGKVLQYTPELGTWGIMGGSAGAVFFGSAQGLEAAENISKAPETAIQMKSDLIASEKEKWRTGVYEVPEGYRAPTDQEITQNILKQTEGLEQDLISQYKVSGGIGGALLIGGAAARAYKATIGKPIIKASGGKIKAYTTKELRVGGKNIYQQAFYKTPYKITQTTPLKQSLYNLGKKYPSQLSFLKTFRPQIIKQGGGAFYRTTSGQFSSSGFKPKMIKPGKDYFLRVEKLAGKLKSTPSAAKVSDFVLKGKYTPKKDIFLVQQTTANFKISSQLQQNLLGKGFTIYKGSLGKGNFIGVKAVSGKIKVVRGNILQTTKIGYQIEKGGKFIWKGPKITTPYGKSSLIFSKQQRLFKWGVKKPQLDLVVTKELKMVKIPGSKTQIYLADQASKKLPYSFLRGEKISRSTGKIFESKSVVTEFLDDPLTKGKGAGTTIITGGKKSSAEFLQQLYQKPVVIPKPSPDVTTSISSTIIKPTIDTGVSLPLMVGGMGLRSIPWEGTQTYERTGLFTIQDTITDQKPDITTDVDDVIIFGSSPTTTPKPDSILSQTSPQIETVKTTPAVIPGVTLQQTVTTKSILGTSTTTPTSGRPGPRKGTPIIFKKKKDPILFDDRRKRKIFKGFFTPQVKRKGIWKDLPKKRTKKAAKISAILYTKRTLGASFRIKKSDEDELLLLDRLPFGFRPSKKQRGVYVQKRRFRLGTRSEVGEIIKSRGKVKWL